MTGTSAKASFAALESHKAELAAKCDLPMTWHNPVEAKSCKVYVRRDGDFKDRAHWPELFAWLLRYLEQFRATFGPLIHEL